MANDYFLNFYYNYFQKNEKFNVKDNRNRFLFKC